MVESIPLLLSTVEERTFSALAMAALAPLPVSMRRRQTSTPLSEPNTGSYIGFRISNAVRMAACTFYR